MSLKMARKGMNQVSVYNPNKVLSASEIGCGGEFDITLSLCAEPNITENPVDIALVLDRSGSMSGSPLVNLKKGASSFIDIIEEATDGKKDGEIGNGSTMGIVSFSNTATKDTQLITSVADLKAAVNGLSAKGSTNHADAFTKALELLDNGSANQKIIVIFTDGVTNTGGDPAIVADEAKAKGVIIYCIGLEGDQSLDEAALKKWASLPTDEHLAITPDESELEKLFEDIAQSITSPGATNIVITDKLNECFEVVSIEEPSKGTAKIIDSTTVEWKIDKLGARAPECASFKFRVKHTGSCSGLVTVNDSVKYSDEQGHTLTFPSPKIEVDCGDIVIPEPCPVPVNVVMKGCKDSVEVNAGDIDLASCGRILSVDVTINDVCPNKRVALAVILTEVDMMNKEHRRGVRTFTIPGHSGDSCRDVTVKCIKFVVPEDLNVSSVSGGMCGDRRFKLRFLANYIDSDFSCCGSI